MTAARERILDAAERLFAAHGFDGTPTSRLATEAGVPKGLVFHYFPRKVDVLATLARERSPSVPAPEAVPDPAASGALAAALLAVADSLRAEQHSAMHRILMRDGGRHPEVRSCLDRVYQQVLRHVRAVIDGALPDGVPTGDTTSARQAAAVTFTAALMHAVHHGHLTGSAFDLSPVAATIAAGLMAAQRPAGWGHAPAGPLTAGG